MRSCLICLCRLSRPCIGCWLMRLMELWEMCVLPSPLLFLSFTPIDIRDARANRIDAVISCLYPTRTIFQRKKKHFLHIPRPGVNRNLRKYVLRRVNSNRRDRVMGCIRRRSYCSGILLALYVFFMEGS